MAKEIEFCEDLIKYLEKHGFHELMNVPVKYNDGFNATQVQFYPKEFKNVRELKPETPFVAFEIDDETDGFVRGWLSDKGVTTKKVYYDTYDELDSFFKRITESKKSVRKSLEESNDFYFEVVFYKDVAKAKEYIKEIYNEFLKKYGYSKNDITWKLTSKGIGFSSSSENIGFDLEDYILDHMYEYGDYEFETDYELIESKKSAKKSLKESLNFKKDYAVEVMGTDWLRPFYWYFNEFRDDLLIASEEYGFTYYITEATTTEYRINIKFNDNFNVSYDIKFRIISKTDKATAKELNDYLN